jgi:hypothetical protein
MAIDVTNDMVIRTDRLVLKDWRAFFTDAEKDEYLALQKAIERSYRYVKENQGKVSDDKVRVIVESIQQAKNTQKRIMYKYDFEKFVDDMFNGEDALQDKTPTPKFHLEMYSAFSQAQRVCIVCPRGHGKSSTSRIYILHQILHGMVKYVILLGSSEDMAGQNMRWIRDQFTDNAMIKEVYGELYNKKKWAETEFVTSTNIKIVAKGAGQKIRGANEKGRPDLIYIDDLEDDEQVANRENRMKLANWFMRAVMPIRSKTGRFIVTGTILDNDSLLKNIAMNRYRDHLRWKVLWYQALNVNDVTGKEEALWQDMHPVEQLQSIREADPQMFAQEYQNNPTSGQMAVFRIEQFQWFKRSDIEIVDGDVKIFGKKCHCMLHTDLAVSERTGADFTVLGVSAMSEDGSLYWPEVWKFRSNDIYDTISDIFRLIEMYNLDICTMEAIAFQKAVKRQIEREMDLRKKHFYIQEMPRHGTTKMARFKGLQSPVRAGKLFFLEEHQPYVEEEFLQLTATKLPNHDDFMDVVADGWETQVEARGRKVKETVEVNTIEWARKSGQLKHAFQIQRKKRTRIR